jgi:hypothetical protein
LQELVELFWPVDLGEGLLGFRVEGHGGKFDCSVSFSPLLVPSILGTMVLFLFTIRLSTSSTARTPLYSTSEVRDKGDVRFSLPNLVLSIVLLITFKHSCIASSSVKSSL